MLKKAKEIKADFIFTGEVLDERPMSQNKKSLGIVAEEAGIEVLRPLSAKLLKETDAEKKGLVDRNRLLAIKGKSRKPQLELVKKFKIKEYETPAGVCLLTHIEFARKLKSKSEETNAKDTYSSRLGIKKSVLVYLLICFIVYALFIYMLLSLGFSLMIFVISLTFLNLVIFTSLIYISKNTKTSSLILQSFAALFYISMHLLLVFTKI